MTGAADQQHSVHSHIDWRHPNSAVRDVRSHVWLWGLALAGVSVDLWTKAWAFRSMTAGETRSAIPGLLDFQLSLNPGALFGMGTGMVGLFIAASVAALAFVFYLFTGTSRDQRLVHIALASILAGALGNLYDRSFHQCDMVYPQGASRPLLGEIVVADSTDEVIAVRPWYDPQRIERHVCEELREPARRVGVVRDFLKIKPVIAGRQIWPWIFNIADVLLVVGVALLLLSYWSRGRPDAVEGQVKETTSVPAAD